MAPPHRPPTQRACRTAPGLPPANGLPRCPGGPVSRRLSPAWLTARLLLVLAVAACGGPASDTLPAATIGAAGGSTQSADGNLLVEIPAGALAANAQFTVTRVDPDAWPVEIGDARVLGQVYELGPTGLTFNQPVSLTQSIAMAEAGIDPATGIPLLMAAGRSADGTWTVVDDLRVAVDGEHLRVTTAIDHFSQWVILGGAITLHVEPTRVQRLVRDSFTATATLRASDRLGTRVGVTSVLAILSLFEDPVLEHHDPGPADLPVNGYGNVGLPANGFENTVLGPGQQLSWQFGLRCREEGEQDFRIRVELEAVWAEFAGDAADFMQALFTWGNYDPQEDLRLWRWRMQVLGTAACQEADVEDVVGGLFPDAGVAVSLGTEPEPGHVVVFRLDDVDFLTDGLYVVDAHPPFCDYVHVHGPPIQSLYPAGDGAPVTRSEHLGECGYGPPNFFMVQDLR